MKMENKLIATLATVLTLCLVIFTAGCTKQAGGNDALDKILQRGKIIVGVKYDTKPFGYMNEKGELDGFDIDLAKQITKCLLGDSSKIEFKQVTSSNRILSLNSGEVDMIIATMTENKQRNMVVDFSIPYYVAGQALLVPKNSNVQTMSDLNGKRVIIIFGSTSEKNLRQIAPDAIIMGYKTYTSGYSALKQGRADAMTSDDTILREFAIQDPSLKLLPKRYSNEPYAVAFKKGDYSKRLRNKVNDVIEDMTQSGELRQLKAKWIKL